MQETQVRSLGWEYPLEEGMITHCSILAWRIRRDRGAWQAVVHVVPNSRKSEGLSTAQHKIDSFLKMQVSVLLEEVRAPTVLSRMGAYLKDADVLTLKRVFKSKFS